MTSPRPTRSFARTRSPRRRSWRPRKPGHFTRSPDPQRARPPRTPYTLPPCPKVARAGEIAPRAVAAREGRTPGERPDAAPGRGPGPAGALRRDRTATPARPLRPGPGSRRTTVRRRGGHLPRLLEESRDR